MIDVRRAYFYAAARRRVSVEAYLLRIGRRATKKPAGYVLQASPYGTRDAAQNWEEELGSFLVKLGFRKGRGSPWIYVLKGKLQASVHGDDVTVTGDRNDGMAGEAVPKEV